MLLCKTTIISLEIVTELKQSVFHIVLDSCMLLSKFLGINSMSCLQPHLVLSPAILLSAGGRLIKQTIAQSQATATATTHYSIYLITMFPTNKNPFTNMDIALLEQKVQRQSATPFPMSNSSARRVYSPLSTRTPQQPDKVSSHLMSKTLHILNNHAQQSRLHNLASVAQNTSLALELARARQKKAEYQKQQLAQRLYQRRGLPFQPQQSQPSDVVSSPSDVDVLLGRGGRSNHHIGNARFRELIRRNRAQYNSLPKHEKIKLSRAIVGVVQDLGGRFLEPARDGNYYVVATSKRAVEKTSQCLREKRTDGNHKSLATTAAVNQRMLTPTDYIPAGTTSKAA